MTRPQRGQIITAILALPINPSIVAKRLGVAIATNQKTANENQIISGSSIIN